MKRTEIKISEGHTRIIYGDVVSGNNSQGVVVKITEGVDGSRLDKPMSRAYVNNIRSRKYTCDSTSPRIMPGDYGSGKRVPRD